MMTLLQMPTYCCSSTLININFSVGGADTTAFTLTYVTYYIVSTPRVWERLCQEIWSAFSSFEQIDGQSTAALHYLEATIRERT
jgi:cytochrome P450